MPKTNRSTFYCFSPVVMVLTIVIEVLLVLYVLIRVKKSLSLWLGLVMLLCLAVFQLAEYGVCESVSFGGNTWAKIGFSAITILPVAGLHLIYAIAGSKPVTIIMLAYLSGIMWMGLFTFGGIMESQVCEGNYVIFNLTETFGGAYFMYYYFWLLFGSTVAINLAKTVIKSKSSALKAMAVGYASFTIPATFIWFVYDGAAKGLPSIMCGFAVIFALILGLYILPRTSDNRK